MAKIPKTKNDPSQESGAQQKRIRKRIKRIDISYGINNNNKKNQNKAKIF